MLPLAERVVFAPTMEGLWRALQPCNEAERAAFLKAGVKEPPVWQPAYVLSDFLHILDTAAAERFPGLSAVDAYHQLGRMTFQSFEKTLAGRAMVPLLKLLGPKRSLLRLTRYFQNANNFTDADVQEVGPNHFIVKLSNVTNPGSFQGVMEAASAHTNAVDFTVKILGVDADQLATFEVTWR